MGVLKALLLALVWAVSCAAAGSAAAASPAAPTEYQLKAVFLFNFARFVEWPPQAFTTSESPLAICVLGKDPFGADLDEAVRGETAMGRPLVVRRFGSAASAADAAELESCHILFLPRSGLVEFDAVLASLKGRSTLVVSDATLAKEVGPRGVMIGFVKERNRIRLRIDLDAAQEAGLSISSKLLRLADVVGGAKS